MPKATENLSLGFSGFCIWFGNRKFRSIHFKNLEYYNQVFVSGYENGLTGQNKYIDVSLIKIELQAPARIKNATDIKRTTLSEERVVLFVQAMGAGRKSAAPVYSAIICISA